MTSHTVTTNSHSPKHRARSGSSTKYNIVRRLLSPSGLRHGFMTAQSPSEADLDMDTQEDISQIAAQETSHLASEDAATRPLQTGFRSNYRRPKLSSASSPRARPPLPPPPPPEVMGAAMLGLRPSGIGFGTSRTRERAVPQNTSMQKQLAARNAPPVPSVLLLSQGPFLQLVQDTIKTQEKLVRKRLATIGHKNDLRAQLQHYSDAREEFNRLWTQALPAIEDSGLDPDLRARLLQAQKASEQRFTTVNKRQQVIDNDRDVELLRLESRYLSQVTELSKHLKDFIPEVEIDSDAFFSELSENHFRTRSRPPSIISSSSSTSTITVHRRYLKTIGTITLLRDKIFNWKGELHLEMDQRDFDREQKLEPAIPDHEFFAGFQHRYRAIIEEYWATKEEMAQTYQECREAGLDPAPANLPPYLDQLFSKDNGVIKESGMKDDQFMQSDLSRNILQWARHVDDVARAGAYEVAADIDPVTIAVPQHDRESDSTDDDWSTVAHSVTSFPSAAQHMPSFGGEIPKDRWRYSAPMLLERTSPDEPVRAFDYQSLRLQRMQARLREFKFGLRRAHSVRSQS